MSSTLYLHIGFEKTGSTAIQSFLEQNSVLLNKNYNLFYPESLTKKRHIKLAVLAAPRETTSSQKRLGIHSGDALTKFIDDFSKELSKGIYNAINHSKDIILSSEHLSSKVNTVEDLGKFADYLESFGIPIKIIAYVRRQDQFVLSRYNTWIKNGGVSQLRLNENSKILKYVDIIRLWESRFGKSKLIVKPYNPAKWKDQNIIYDFFDTLNKSINQDIIFQNKRQNSSLDSKGLMMLKALNEHLPLFKDGKINKLRGNLANTISDLSIGAKIKLSNSDKHKILSKFKTENAILEKEFNIFFDYSDLDIGSFEEYAGDLDFNEEYNNIIQHQDIYQLSAFLWQKQQEKINYLITKVKELEKKKEPDSLLKKTF